MKEFNVTGICVPGEHYMVDISGKLDQIVELIDKRKYFTINRARQYGKTTTFAMLDRRLADRYHVIWMSFEGIGEIAFKNDIAFMRYFVNKVTECLEYLEDAEELVKLWKCLDDYKEEQDEDAFDYLSRKITALCKKSKKEFVLMIDEVDKSSDNQIFLNFLGMLRNKYLFSKTGRDVTFQSVILAGVYDVKNLKLKLRPDEERKYNSPWNIATEFNIDMSFSPAEIGTMLVDYEKDHHTGMDIEQMSDELYFYTSGYPYLVSSMCKWIDEEGGKEWTIENLQRAEKEILRTRNTLFDDLIKNIENDTELKQLVMNILYNGATQSFSMANQTIALGVMFGIFAEKDYMVSISNVIFETYLYDYVISVKSIEESMAGPERNQFIREGKLDMPQVLLKFQELMRAEYRTTDDKFIE